MRKYGKWLLVLGVMAASPAVASADGFLGGFKPQLPFSSSAEKARNQELANEVAGALKSAQVKGTGIENEVREGAAILEGRVSDPSQLSLAQRAAGTVPGIERVENNLKYTPPAGGQVQPAAANAEDMQAAPVTRAASMQAAGRKPAIQQVSGTNPAPAKAENNSAVAQKIAQSVADAGLVGYDIEVRYSGGTATLLGQVGSAAERQAASKAAGSVGGVQKVNNRLTVANPVAQTGMPSSGPGQMMMQGQPMMHPGMQGQMMHPAMQGQQMMHPAMQGQMMAPPMQVAMQQQGMMGPGMPPTASGYAPTSFNHPNLPNHAWPSYAQYPNSAAVSYPTQYSASAWPYIGPFYPYPQVPMGWREVSLEWDDGNWQLNFNKEKDKWYWVFNPKNW